MSEAIDKEKVLHASRYFSNFALLKRDPRSNGFGLLKSRNCKQRDNETICPESGNKVSPKQTPNYYQSRPRPLCVWTFVDSSFLLRGPRPGSASGMGGTCQGQRTIAKRLTKTVITRIPPYMINCVFNLRQTDWLGKHGPDFHLFLSQWSSYLFHNVLNS